MYKLYLCILLLDLSRVELSNILVVCPFPGKSHSQFIHPIVNGLAEKGHNITIITSIPMKEPRKNIREITPNVKKAELDVDQGEFYKWGVYSLFLQLFIIWEMASEMTEEYIETDTVQSFLKEDNQFDVVILEDFFHEAYYGFSHKYNAPLILLGTGTYTHAVGEVLGNPTTLSYTSFEFDTETGNLDILHRTYYYLLYLYSKYVYELLYYPRHQSLMKKHFGDSVPSVGQLKHNISAALFNTHFSVDHVKPLIPCIVEIGGVHLNQQNELPKDLKRFLDEAVDGFIYFNFGSHLRSASMSKEKLDAVIKVFNKLKLKVLWKWEDDKRPKVGSNVMTSKWLPQADVLAHPNIRIFITHGGMLSTQEVAHKGVPVIGIPVYGDQFLNMAKLEEIGMGIRLPFSQLNEATFTNAIERILKDPKYTIMAKEVSMRFKDRINTPLDTAVYWVEYVMRHKGAPFLRSKLPTTSWFQYNLIDIYGFMFLIVFTAIYLIIQAIKLLSSLRKTVFTQVDKKKN